ncbi:hypothetical protein DM01DRAFT_1330731 [Hesseltinella vesiculosa]|uniref:RGS domain-containing protein n=1 Tax=Hesseltinella vesiculosa TaxID=101127 RepID=A0A1X2GWY0_9FUNG|nr:hypothetical protein DM01DRAFT_1330731 [Hesseltinella vesiculosa]
MSLENALESDLTLQQQQTVPIDDEKNDIPMHQFHRPSNNPYHSMISQSDSVQQKPQDPFSVAPMEAWQEMKDYNLQVHGIPTLDQLLRLPTSSPITQAQFATFLRRRGSQQNLNFLLELETHQRLWQAHLDSEERQQRPGIQKDRSSKQFMDLHPSSPTATYFEMSDTQNLLQAQASPSFYQHNNLSSTYASRTVRNDGSSLSRHDVVQNALRVYRTFCSRYDAAQPVHLPEDHCLALETLVEQHQRPEPAIFESARSHVFDVLNMFYYPQFVDAVLYTNVSTISARLYLTAGLILLIFSFSLEFAFIFLDFGNTATRWWPFLPFLFSWSFVITGVTHFAWWSAWLRKSEASFLVSIPVQDKTVVRIQRKRAFIWCLGNIIIAFVTSILFVFVPPHRI